MQSPFLIVPLLSMAGSPEPAVPVPTVLQGPVGGQGGRPFAPLVEGRSLDGSGNHPDDPLRGSTFIPLRRLTSTGYADGADAPAGARRPSARFISNGVLAQTESVPAPSGISDLFWQWGQFLDHDLTETPIEDPAESFPIAVPLGDLWFDPASIGGMEIPLSRSFPLYVDGVRQQINAITAWIDGSQVYGSDAERAEALRTNDGTGRLKVSSGDLLPFNVDGFHNAPSDLAPNFFLAGDIRANEQVGLTAMHTLFVREHNHWADRIAEEDRQWRMSQMQGGGQSGGLNEGHGGNGGGGNGRALTRDGFRAGSAPALTGDQIYELARAIVSAELQIITYREWLPLLLGASAPGLDSVYRPELDGTISNEFATAAFRIGHTMLSSNLERLDRRGRTIPEGHLSLADAFFAPQEIVATGIDPVLRGLSASPAEALDMMLIDEVRNLLFGPPGSGGLDLGALNLQRGRDHGLASYCQARRDLGLGAPASFADMSSSPTILERLSGVARNPEDLDLWVGALAEDPLDGALVGETFHTILSEQFLALRDGDRLWYSRQLPPPLVQLAEQQSLSHILERNSGLRGSYVRTPFLADE
ncbi:peroxidase [Planctomycetes bacterium Poly30]|uniref:Peroxidase n=1 Tax=Saltatorellus ferox TaxID=2528018 RepID=A0A518ELT7_9BACT|nr:peroxidase [Planctomycetes bacterium Poly30]